MIRRPSGTGKVKLRSVGTDLVPFGEGAITVHDLTDGQRVASLWILARAVGADPGLVRAGVDLLPRRLRDRMVRFLRDGAATLGMPMQLLADLAALPADVVPDSFRPIWQAARR